MRLVPVASTMLVALGWDPEDGTMIAQFSETSFYQYERVPAETAARVIFAESVGKSFQKYIKNGKFVYLKVTAEEVFAPTPSEKE